MRREVLSVSGLELRDVGVPDQAGADLGAHQVYAGKRQKFDHGGNKSDGDEDNSLPDRRHWEMGRTKAESRKQKGGRLTNDP